MKALESLKTSVRGVTFFPKIFNYISDHYNVGELNMKPLKLRKISSVRYVQMACKVPRWIESHARSLTKRLLGIKVSLIFRQLLQIGKQGKWTIFRLKLSAN